MLRIFYKLFWGCMVDGKWSNREPRGVIRPGRPAIKCTKIFNPLQTLIECIRSDYSGIQAGGGGCRWDSNGPRQDFDVPSPLDAFQAAGMHVFHGGILECRPYARPGRCAGVECLAGMQPGGQELHTCMHDWSILADLDLKVDADRVLQPIS